MQGLNNSARSSHQFHRKHDHRHFSSFLSPNDPDFVVLSAVSFGFTLLLTSVQPCTQSFKCKNTKLVLFIACQNHIERLLAQPLLNADSHSLYLIALASISMDWK